MENVVVTAPVPARKFGPRTDHRYCSVPVETMCVAAVPECTGEVTCETPAPTVVQRLRSSCVGASKNASFAVLVEMEKSDAWLWSERKTAFRPAARALRAMMPRSGRASALTVLWTCRSVAYICEAPAAAPAAAHAATAITRARIIERRGVDAAGAIGAPWVAGIATLP